MPLPPKAPDPTLRTRVLDTAATLLARDGLGPFTLDAVARELGVPVAKLTEVCFSREDLIFQVLKQQVDALISRSNALIEPDVPVMELMRGLSEMLAVEIQAKPLLLDLLLGQAAAALPQWSQRLDELRSRLMAVALRVVEVGREQEILRTDLPADLVAGLLFEIHVAGHLLHRQQAPEAPLRATQRRLAILEVLYNGLRPR
jgi:AcrR family transcriptional regulator